MNLVPFELVSVERMPLHYTAIPPCLLGGGLVPVATAGDNRMMTVTRDELAQFHLFAERELSNGSAESIEQLVDL